MPDNNPERSEAFRKPHACIRCGLVRVWKDGFDEQQFLVDGEWVSESRRPSCVQGKVQRTHKRVAGNAESSDGRRERFVQALRHYTAAALTGLLAKHGHDDESVAFSDTGADHELIDLALDYGWRMVDKEAEIIRHQEEIWQEEDGTE